MRARRIRVASNWVRETERGLRSSEEPSLRFRAQGHSQRMLSVRGITFFDRGVLSTSFHRTYYCAYIGDIENREIESECRW